MRIKTFYFSTSSAFALGLVLLLSFAGMTKAGEIIEGNQQDGMLTQGVVNNGAYGTTYNFQLGALYGTDSECMVEPFALPYLAPGQQVTAASISFYLESFDGTPTYNLQLYGLNRVSATSPLPLTTDWYTGTSDAANTLLDPTLFTPSSATQQAATYSGSNLVSFVQKQYANAAFSGQDLSTTRYIFFRVSPDGTQSGFNNYVVGNARNPIRAEHPILSLTISNGISNIAGRLQFSFNLPQASTTSAGVYNSTTGALIRTIWNNVQYQAGMNYGVWDGNDDFGNPVATGTPYQIKMIYHNVQYVWEGMIGNTSASQSGLNVYHSFGKMQDMSISGTEAIYSVGYNENQNPFHSFVVGTPQVPSEIDPGYTDPNSSFYFMTSDNTRSYWAKGYGGLNTSDTYVISLNNSNGSLYTFPNGTTPTGAGTSYFYTSCVDFDPTANQPNAASGLAVQRSGNDLFVSHANLNVVRVFDKVKGTLLGTIPVTSPERLATTANGDVWVISGGATPTVQRYTFANGSATLDQTITGLANPAGVGVSADDSVLLIADGGSSQQIKAYANATGTPLWTYGTLGGLAVNGPNVTTNTFEFNTQLSNYNSFTNQAFIAFQPDNTFWIEDGGSSRVLHFAISGNTLSYLEQIAYNDVSYRSTVDLTDATRVFNNFLEYSVNYALPLGGTNGSWTLVRNWAYNLPSDSTHYYFGYTNGFTNVVTLSNGRTYGFLTNTINSNMDLFELPASGPARFTGYSYNTSPRMYPDGTLRFNVSTSSTLSFYSQPLTGFNSDNDPVWGSPTLIATTALGANDPLTWGAFPERTETTAGGMVINFDGNLSDTGYHLGGIPLQGSAWKWRSSITRNISGLWFPEDGKFDVANGVQYAGNYAMALGHNIVYGYHGEFWGGGEASQWVNFYDNGLMVGRFGTYGNASLTTSHVMNGFSGNSFSPTLVHAPDGNTYLYHNDESNHSGTVRWRIAGWDGITQMQAIGSIGGVTSLSASTSGPSVTITSPTAGALYSNGGTVSFSADAASSGASITSVQFFDGSTSLGTVTLAPYNLNVSGLSAGSHVITAVATDSGGLSTTSPSVTITVAANGTNAPPAAPISLSTGTVAAQSVGLTWTQPTVGATSSTIGQIISFQCDVATDGNALAPTAVAGAPSYAVDNFNLLGQSGTNGITYMNVVNSAGATIPNLGINLQIGGGTATNSIENLTGTAAKLFSQAAGSWTNAPNGFGISNIPYAYYDVVVYSQPGWLNAGAGSSSVTLSNSVASSAVQQTFTQFPAGYSVSTVPFGSNTSVTNANVVVFQGLNTPAFNLFGGNIEAIQIVQRPYDQGAPTSYKIERATGTSTNFAVVGTVSAPATSYTDTSNLTASTTYQYQIAAVNSYGTSAFSNTVSVTTPSAAVSAPPPTTPGFSAWQAQYFTAAQLANSAISGPNANPFGSGVPNLLAYALQLNPATVQPTDVPTPVVNNGHLQITYLVPSSVTDINYIVEVSSDLQTWNTGAGYTQVTSSVVGANGTTITVQDTLPVSVPNRYMHLRVMQQ